MLTRVRKHLKKNQFAWPAKRKYPIDTRDRAINAKARAQQMYNKGKLSRSMRDKIIARANRALKRLTRKG